MNLFKDYNRSKHSAHSALKGLKIYMGSIGLIAFIMQIVILVSHTNTLLCESIGVGLIALIFMGYLALYGKALDRLRFGTFMANVGTYIIVNVSNLFGFALAALSSHSELPHLLANWAPTTICMGALWGLGVTIHLFATLFSNGYGATTDLSLPQS